MMARPAVRRVVPVLCFCGLLAAAAPNSAAQDVWMRGGPEGGVVQAVDEGDGRADLAIYRPGTGEWFGFGSSTGAFGPILFGNPALGDVPLTSSIRY